MVKNQPGDGMKLIICGREYSVGWISGEDSYRNESGVGGSHNGQTHEIKISRYTKSPDEDILHELIHAVNSSADIGLTEHQVTVLATMLLDTIRRNRIDLLYDNVVAKLIGENS